MAYQPVDGAVLYEVSNVVPFTKQGTSFIVGGGFTTTPGVPSQQLLPSTNTVLGYFNGCMLATASGTTGSAPTALTAGAMVNWDASSTDTGQAVWNGFIICDESLTFALPINTTYPGTVQCATPRQGWVIRQQFLYGHSTPALDAAAVQTAVHGSSFGCIQTSSSNPAYDQASEVVFAY